MCAGPERTNRILDVPSKLVCFCDEAIFAHSFFLKGLPVKKKNSEQKLWLRQDDDFV